MRSEHAAVRVGRGIFQSTTLRFGVASLVPILVLGVFLTASVQRGIEDRTTAVYGNMSAVLFRMAADVVFRPEDFETGVPMPEDRAHIVDELIARGASENSDVRVSIFDRQGRLVYANGTPRSGQALGRPEYVTALEGEPAARYLRNGSEDDEAADPRASDVLEVYLPVRFKGDPKVYGVIAASGLDGSTIGSIDVQVKEVRSSLGLGLVGLWLALFPIVFSVSRRIRRASTANRHLAQHDSLTGLPNRNLLHDRLTHALARAGRTGTDVGLLLVDLDRFKEVNDTLGHGRGDELLIGVADRLQRCVRPGDTVARLGGDEFAVVVDGLPNVADLAIVARRLLEALGEPLVVDGIEVVVQGSIGGAISPVDGDDGEELLRHADIAMYAAKATDEGFVLYSGDLDAHSPTQLAIAAELRRALEVDDQLVVHYQPVASPQTGKIVAVEALVRWAHPTRGLLYPPDFIPIAEQSGLIRRLSAKVLEASLAQQRQWADQGMDLTMSVNLSVCDLRNPMLAAEVQAALVRNRVAPDRLELEVTETAILGSADAAVEVVDAIRRLGVAVALDDFGTGYSSLTFLKRLSPDRLKIDRSFVDAMTHDATDAKIVRALIELARSLEIGVTAEGVETAEHWYLLAELSCDLVQGYYLARPLDPATFAEWLSTRVPAESPLVTAPLAVH